MPEYSLIEEESYLQDLTFNTLKIFLDNKGINYNDNNFYKNNKLLTPNGKFNYLAFILSEQFDLSFKIAKLMGIIKEENLFIVKNSVIAHFLK